MNIEERAKDDLIWLKDNWVIDWAEPEQSRFKFAIEDILKVLDSKDKQIEELKEENTELADKLYKERENVREITNIAGIALLRRPVEITNKTLYEKKFTVEIENNYFNDSKIYRSKEI